MDRQILQSTTIYTRYEDGITLYLSISQSDGGKDETSGSYQLGGEELQRQQQRGHHRQHRPERGEKTLVLYCSTLPLQLSVYRGRRVGRNLAVFLLVSIYRSPALGGTKKMLLLLTVFGSDKNLITNVQKGMEDRQFRRSFVRMPEGLRQERMSILDSITSSLVLSWGNGLIAILQLLPPFRATLGCSRQENWIH